jgi:hypothetical protein
LSYLFDAEEIIAELFGGGMKRLSLLAAVFILALSPSLLAQSMPLFAPLFGQSECDQVQNTFDQLSIKDSVPWQSLQQAFPEPFVTQSAVAGGKVFRLLYVYAN